jgi:hypothetical protein
VVCPHEPLLKLCVPWGKMFWNTELDDTPLTRINPNLITITPGTALCCQPAVLYSEQKSRLLASRTLLVVIKRISICFFISE